MKKPEKFICIAEDFNSPFFRNYLFVKGTSNFPKLLGIQGPTMAIWSVQNRIRYFTRMTTWKQAHEDLKKRVQKNPSYIEKLIDLADIHGKKMNVWTQKNIYQKNLKTLSNKQLINLWYKFNIFGCNEYTYGVSLPILDFQGFSLVENSIKEYLKTHVAKNKFQNYYSVFTEPLFDSYSQEQEKKLLKIMAKYFPNPKWLKDVKNCDPQTIKKNHPHFWNDLKVHTKHYAWVYYVYRGPAFTEIDFLTSIQDSLKQKINPNKRLIALKNKKQITEKLKKQFLKELNPDHFNASMLKLAGKLVWAKPRRKDYQSRSYFHLEKLQKEIGKRLFLSLQQVRSLPLDFIKKHLSSKRILANSANKMFDSHICVRNGNNKVKIISGKDSYVFGKNNFYKISPESEKNTGNIKQFSGQIAFPGKVKGQVKIINRLEDIHKMETGDILVSIATTPSVVPAMKKAAAILTDEGGLTCHASIVSREMETPCIVGLKNISRILKDGDLIEVNANTGTVKLISKK